MIENNNKLSDDDLWKKCQQDENISVIITSEDLGLINLNNEPIYYIEGIKIL